MSPGPRPRRSAQVVESAGGCAALSAFPHRRRHHRAFAPLREPRSVRCLHGRSSGGVRPAASAWTTRLGLAGVFRFGLGPSAARLRGPRGPRGDSSRPSQLEHRLGDARNAAFVNSPGSGPFRHDASTVILGPIPTRTWLAGRLRRSASDLHCGSLLLMVICGRNTPPTLS